MSPLYVSTVYYEFNSAITGLNQDTGKFDNDAHREQVLPLRGKIMQLDGVNGMNISRYGMTIEYVSALITEPEAIDKVVDETIAWAAEQPELFPLRGDKTPKATRQTS